MPEDVKGEDMGKGEFISRGLGTNGYCLPYGLKVIRFRNEDVICNFEDICKEINEFISEISLT